MGKMLGRKEIQRQSWKAYRRWESLWHENAKGNQANSKPFDNIKDAGKNKGLIIFAFGPSFNENIEAVKENKLHYEYDVMCVDKALKSCINNGIIPNYVYIADAQVDFEKYGKIDPSICERTTLIMAVTANHAWSDYWIKNGGKVYFVVNEDGIKTHKVFKEYFDYTKDEAYLIPASSNVANSAYVFSSLVLNYKEILLAAFDYSYRMGGNYYGDSSKPTDTNYGFKKHSFNNHYTMLDIRNDLVQVSHNMQFSAKWLMDFVRSMEMARKNVTVNVTGRGVLMIKNQAEVRRAA